MDVDLPKDMRTPELEQAAMLCDRGRIAEALAVLRPLLAEDPHDLDALGLLGEAQLADHDPDGALATASTAIGLDPERHLPHRQASIAASRRGLHREAIAHAEEAVRLDSDDHRGFVALARALLRAKRDLERARHVAVRAIVIAPDAPEPHLVFGMVSRAEGEDWAAEGAFRRVLQLDPGNIAARNELARLSVRRATLGLQAGPAESVTGSAQTDSADVPIAVSRRSLDHLARFLLSRVSRSRVTA
jgi:tetratricopeptide (TPR) repeat protein